LILINDPDAHACKLAAQQEIIMRAHQVMTKSVVTVTPETTIVEAANIMLQRHVSALPVLDPTGKLVGIVSEGDFIRRSEIGTQRKRGRWLRFLLGPGEAANDFIREHGRKISEVMTPAPHTVTEETTLEQIVASMESNGVKRLPVMRGDKLVGIVSRANLLQAVASLAREIPDPTADDDHIRRRVIDVLEKNDWCPIGLGVVARGGIVHLSGLITEERWRQAAIVGAENVAGVKKVHDHLCWIDPMSGLYVEAPEDVAMAKAS
jgi:CBS domain-containing protein